MKPTYRFTCIAGAIMTALAGCGGNDESASGANREPPASGTAASAELRAKTLAVPPSGAADAGTLGAWGSLNKWPLIPVHAVTLPDGRVLTYGSSTLKVAQTAQTDWALPGSDAIFQQTGNFIYDIWDPAAGFSKSAHLVLPNETTVDSFCSAQLLLPQNGSVFLAGGDKWNDKQATYFGGTENLGTRSNLVMSFPAGSSPQLTANVDPLDKQVNAKLMSRPRWYATTTTLPTGDVFIHGGRPNLTLDPNTRTYGATSPTTGILYAPEVRNSTDGTFSPLAGAGGTTGASQKVDFSNYPRNFVAPNGQIVGASETGHLYKIRTDVSKPDPSDPLKTIKGEFIDVTGAQQDSVALVAANQGTAVAYQLGRALFFGGDQTATWLMKMPNTSSEGIVFQNLNANLNAKRWYVNGTVLADGQVLATGGTGYWRAGYADENFKDDRNVEIQNIKNGVQSTPYLYNPASNQWKAGKPAPSDERGRFYHSMAMLLPDATVLVGGGGAHKFAPYNNNDTRLYFPPYLFDKTTGAPASRPVITSAPQAEVQLGTTISVGVQTANGQPPSKFTLVKTSSVTHGFNMEQRFIELRNLGWVAGGYTLQMPRSNATLTPGYYMLFAFDAAGVPSVAKILKIGISPAATEYAPVLNVEYSPARVAANTTYQVKWTSHYASDIKYSCAGAVNSTGDLPPGAGYAREGSSSTVGQRTCTFTATGPGGSTSVTKTFEVY